MSMRVSRASVTFAHPFTLSSVSGIQPSGTYRVVIEEPERAGLPFQTCRRLIAHLHLPPSACGGDHADQVVKVDPKELADALSADAD